MYSAARLKYLACSFPDGGASGCTGLFLFENFRLIEVLHEFVRTTIRYNYQQKGVK